VKVSIFFNTAGNADFVCECFFFTPGSVYEVNTASINIFLNYCIQY